MASRLKKKRYVPSSFTAERQVSRMVIVQITTDNREPFREYHKNQPWFGTAPEGLLQGFALLPKVEVHVVSCTQKPMQSPEKLAGNIWFHSLHVSKIGWMRSGYMGCMLAVRKKIREIAPDIVHGQGTERECALSAVFSGRPNVLTIHGNMRLISRVNRAKAFSYQWLAAKLETFTIPRSNGVVSITNYTRQAVTGLSKRTWVVPNAVDTRFFDVVPQQNKNERAIILCVGDVMLRKNQNAFIRALDPVASQHKLRVLFLGRASRDDPYVREFFELIGKRSWCEHVGFENRDGLKNRFSEASLLVLPSLEDNCPMVVLEAMAAGVPVIAAKVGGVPDLVEQGRTGLFCDPNDAASMRTAVEQLLTDAALRSRLSTSAKQGAQERFHPATIARRHIEIYREVLSTSS
jgi:glycosyltransferase involved in cell wall biosynthesis